MNATTTYRCPFAVEGYATVAYEVYAQLGGRAPGVIVVPVGDGPLLTGIMKGFLRLKAAGKLDAPLPRPVAVQADGCAPIARAWR